MSVKDTLVGLALSVVAAWAPSAWAQEDPTGTWAAEQSGSNFYYGAGATDGTYFYIIGGYQPGVVANQYPWYYNGFRRYDPVNNSWSTLTAPTWGGYTYYSIYGNAGGYYDGRIFSFGGYHFYSTASNSYSSNYSNAVLAYTLSTGAWSTLDATLSSGRYFLAAAECATSLGDRIYVMGGYDFNVSSANDEFNPSTNTITGRAAMSTGLYYHTMATATLSNVARVYAMTGYPGPTAACLEYTPPTSSTGSGSWATKPQIQNSSGAVQSRYAARAFTVNDRVYLSGGYGGGSYQSTLFEYNPATELWTQRASSASQHAYHAAVTIGGKGYVYGGIPTYTTCEEYTAPEFGLPPHAPTGVTQSGSRAETNMQALPDASQYDGWTNNQVSFSATITDPDAGQLVRLRVRVKNVSSATWTNLDSGLLDQGLVTVPWTIPANGEYDWMYRVEDSFSNSYPAALINAANDAGWIKAYSNDVSPDFRSDQISPADPVAIGPDKMDIQVPDPVIGNVTLNWIESTDNGPVAGISYELQVARDGGFIDVEAQLFSSAGTDSYPVALTVSRYDKYWRIRARDVGGNLSNWSPALTFRVTYNDGLNHSSGDAKKTCGMSATGGPGLAAALLGFALFGLAAGRRLIRR